MQVRFVGMLNNNVLCVDRPALPNIRFGSRRKGGKIGISVNRPLADAKLWLPNCSYLMMNLTWKLNIYETGLIGR